MTMPAAPQPSTSQSYRGPKAANAVRFPYFYLVFITVSAMDLMLTHTILSIGGIEVNPIANAVLHSPAQFHGLIVYKFAIVVAVMLVCEYLGRVAEPTGRRLAFWAVAISSFPVVWSVLLLLHNI